MAQNPEQAKLVKALAKTIVPLLQSGIFEEERIRGMVAEEVKKQAPVKIEVQSPDCVKTIVGAHSSFPLLLKAVSLGIPTWISGPAGGGKTTAAESVAEALGFPYYALSVCAQTSVTTFLGYTDANGKPVRTDFWRAYTGGGVFVLDEADAGNANVFAVLNSALSNGACSFPDGMARRHENFRLIACANTWGQGADAQYVGRAPLDAATLDRFVMLLWPYDQHIEVSLAAGNLEWLNLVYSFRKAATELGLRVIISPRAIAYGAKLLAAGIGLGDCIESTICKGMSIDTMQRLRDKVGLP